MNNADTDAAGAARKKLLHLRERLKGNGVPSREDLLEYAEVLDDVLRELDHPGRRVEFGLKAITQRHRDLENRLLLLENSLPFRLLRWPGRFLLDWRGRLGQALLHSPLHGLYRKMIGGQAAGRQYDAWLELESLAIPSAEWFEERRKQFRYQPVVSVVMPVYKPKREWLEAAIDSMLRQSYPCWELCVCDDGSPEPWVGDFLAAKAASEPRIRFTRSAENLGISAAANTAGKMATGEYVGFLDQDDVLSPHAIHYVAEAVQEGSVDLIYSDEDRLEGAARVEPIFKPAWSPELLLCCMYLGHFLVVKSTVLDAAGWLRGAFDGSQDYDLALRVTERDLVVKHVPRVLYHWRKHAGSTAAEAKSKPYTHEAGRKALAEALQRRRWPATAVDGPVPNTYRVRWTLSDEPKVSIVICSRNPKLLKRCIASIHQTTVYKNREIIVVQHRTGNDRRMDRFLADSGILHVAYSGSFNYAAMNNLGARAATGDVIVFLNDDIEPLTEGWLTELVACTQRPEVGVAGARLLYPNGTIQHAGIVTGIMEGAGHVCRHMFASAWWHWLPFTRNVSAVTGACLAIRKQVLTELGGFDNAFPVNFNDVDLCLRARQAGYEVVYEPAAVLRHYECRSRIRGVRYDELELWQERWGQWLERGDPYYSPNLTRVREDASLRLNEQPPGAALADDPGSAPWPRSSS